MGATQHWAMVTEIKELKQQLSEAHAEIDGIALALVGSGLPFHGDFSFKVGSAALATREIVSMVVDNFHILQQQNRELRQQLKAQHSDRDMVNEFNQILAAKDLEIQRLELHRSEWINAIATIRDAVLHDRHQLAEMEIDSDITNAVLGIIDDNVPGDESSLDKLFGELRETAACLTEKLSAAKLLLERAVVTKGEDKGVILLSDHGTTHYDEELKCQIYDHEYFSPLGDALIATWEVLKGDEST